MAEVQALARSQQGGRREPENTPSLLNESHRSLPLIFPGYHQRSEETLETEGSPEGARALKKQRRGLPLCEWGALTGFFPKPDSEVAESLLDLSASDGSASRTNSTANLSRAGHAGQRPRPIWPSPPPLRPAGRPPVAGRGHTCTVARRTPRPKASLEGEGLGAPCAPAWRLRGTARLHARPPAPRQPSCRRVSPRLGLAEKPRLCLLRLPPSRIDVQQTELATNRTREHDGA